MRGTGPRAVITDFGVLTPHPESEELQLGGLFAEAGIDEARAAVGWPLRMADDIATLAPPTSLELDTLRALKARTREAHAQPVVLPAWTRRTGISTEPS
jgi:glutaconate CoA-transferase subunit B